MNRIRYLVDDGVKRLPCLWPRSRTVSVDDLDDRDVPLLRERAQGSIHLDLSRPCLLAGCLICCRGRHVLENAIFQRIVVLQAACWMSAVSVCG